MNNHNISTLDLDSVANLLYGKNYNELEPHQQNDVRNTINNPDY